MKVHIITIGDEILIGQVVDTNSAWIARQLNLHGAQLIGISSVGDTSGDIQHYLRKALVEADTVLMTGGLGPTKDDITKKALAEFLGEEMVFDQSTYNRIIRLFEKLQRSITPAHRQQCYMPESAILLSNKMGTAPGMWFELQGQVIVSMPGVPYEMRYLMNEQIIPRLKKRFPGRPIAHRTILTVGEGESRIARRIEAFEDNLPPQIKLAYLPGLGQVRLRLTGTGEEEQYLHKLLDQKASELATIIPDLIYGYGEDSLEAVVGQMLREKGQTLVTAESCTGGYLAHRITTIPGSSDYFLGGVVAYANEVKMNTLKVRSTTLQHHGAVSEQTVVEMVQGALALFGSTMAVAISGIAGPGGGSPEKPVGTIWIAIGDPAGIKTQKLQLGKDRITNIQYTAVQALNMIRNFLLEKDKPAHYHTAGL